MRAETTRPRPGGTGPRAYIAAPGSVQRQYSGAVVQTATRPRRCPWYQDVLRLAAEPARCYSAWRGVAILHAGTGAWERAAPIREACRRAVTVMPADALANRIVWPPVRQWIADCGDLEVPDALELARCLIDCGAELVVMRGDRVPRGICMRRARR